MRIDFKGPFVTLEPIIIPFTVAGTFSFDKTLYPDHIFYDVIVIGAGGGFGGGMSGIDPVRDNFVRNFGGAGGGGGLHRRKGILELLANSTPIVVGAAGSDGADGDDTTPGGHGGDGGYSAFGDFVMATGGHGGNGSQSISYHENQLANGGAGGIGGTLDILAGGGAKGGICGFNVNPDDPTDFTQTDAVPGQNGQLITSGRFYIPASDTYTLKGRVGKGGGGGPGGSYRLVEPDYLLQFPYPAKGGKGSYNSDETLYAPGLNPFNYEAAPGQLVRAMPGRGGGARATPLTNTNAVYGGSGKDGAVFILLTVT